MSAPTSVTCEELFGLRPGVYSATDSAGVVSLLQGRWPTTAPLGKLSPGELAVLRRLAGGSHTVAELRAETDDPDAVSPLIAVLWAGGWLMTTVRWQGRPLYTVEPLSPVVPKSIVDVPVVLSRFTVLHREDDDLVVESPLASAMVRVHDGAAMAALVALTTSGDLPEDVLTRLVTDLTRAGLAVPKDHDEDTESRLRQWRPHELWFHRRSRMGNGGYAGLAHGRTKWGKDFFAPLPARRDDPYPGRAIDLYRPDMSALRRGDLPLTAAIERRRSTRVHDDDHPITADQLGELLYRCSRVRGSFVVDEVEYLKLPYPAGGSVYELELYPVVRKVSGLAQGMYHYDRHEHQLRLVREPGPEVARLLRGAAWAASMDQPPQVLIVLSARFGRLMLTYEEMPYSLLLKHVGVLYQTMYLVATAMGLAACGQGGGDAMAFTEATGLDYATESSVGEFILGSLGAE